MENLAHRKEMKNYWIVFLGLIFLTLASLGIYSLHLNIVLTVILILSVAVIEALLSLNYIMHLASERKSISIILVLSFFFFLLMMVILCAAYFNLPEGAKHVS